MYLSAQLKPPNSHHRVKERHSFAIHSLRHGDVESGQASNGASSSYPLESRSSVQLPKDGIELMEAMDDDTMDLYLQVKNTVNYFSTDQTQKGARSSREPWCSINTNNTTKSFVHRSPLAA